MKTPIQYHENATKARRKVVEMLYKSQKSHIGSCMSVIDILTVLFDLADLKEDRILLGKGWGAAAMFYFLAEYGFIPKEDLDRFCVEGEKEYIGLLEPSVKGIHMASGSVGMGLSFGVGMALARRLDGNKGQVYVIEGDGGMQCGITWESAMVASQHKLNNLTLIVDRNGLQAMDSVDKILDDSLLADKLTSFGFDTITISGHSHEELSSVLCDWKSDKPKAIICDTIKGFGVPDVENKVSSHYVPPTKEQYERAMKELV